MNGPRSRRAPSTFPLPPEVQEVHCPHCDGARVTVASLFGGSVSEMLLECSDCRSFFHWMKWRRADDRAERPGPPGASEANRDSRQ